MLQAILVALFLAGAAGPAAAMTDRQENALTRLAEMIAADRRCSSLKVNASAMAAALVANDITNEDIIEGGRFNVFFMNALGRYEVALADASEDSVCSALEMTYGKNGTFFSNLVVAQ